MKENSFLKLNLYIEYDVYLHLLMAITYTYFCIDRIGYYVVLDRFQICILRIIHIVHGFILTLVDLTRDH